MSAPHVGHDFDPDDSYPDRLTGLEHDRRTTP